MIEISELYDALRKAYKKLEAYDEEHAEVMKGRQSIVDDIQTMKYLISSKKDRNQSRKKKKKGDPRLVNEDGKSRVFLTDHAVIRYLERRYKFDLEAIRSEILTDAFHNAITFGASSVRANGGRFIIDNGTVITFLPASKSTGKKQKHRPARLMTGTR